MTYEFKLSLEIIHLIAKGLRKLPYEESAILLDALQREVTEQDAKAAKASIATNAVESVVGPAKPKRGRKPKAAVAASANGAAEQPQAEA